MFPSDKVNPDNKAYFRFTSPQRLNRAVHELEGILQGISADQRVSGAELSRLSAWVGHHSEFLSCAPFAQTVDMLRTVLADGIVDEQELADLFWMCSRFTDENEYYSGLTADMQRLQGLLGGVIADGHISHEELQALEGWMESRDHLKGCWPFDELESLIAHVLQDGMISAEEQTALLHYFKEFAPGPGKAVALKNELKDYSVAGICALAPTLTFPSMTYCFTGTSKRAPRSKIREHVEERGGAFTDNVTKSTDYLIVGSNGNPCWAFSCYGRKVEQAMKLRKTGHRLLVVHEVDFWDHLN